jgi:virginiamycin B lyase
MHDSAIDFDGNLWFTSTRGSKARTVARVDAKTGETKSFGVPLPDGTMARAHGIFPGPDGRIYFNASPRIAFLDGTLGIINPEAQVVESIPAPAGVSGWLGVDGQDNIWAASGTMQEGGALRFNPTTKEFTVYKSPTAGLTYGIAGDREGNGWWMGVNDDIIVHGDGKTGAVTEIQLPEKPLTEYLKAGDLADGETFGHPGLGGDQSPRRPYADLNGNHVWIPNFFGNTLLRIDTGSKALKYFPLPYAAMNPYEAMVDSQHRVWVTFQNSDEMGRFDPDTEKWTMYSYPTKGMAQRQNHMLERDGVLQFSSASGASHRVGRMVMRSAADVQALRNQVR